jgi:cell division protein FtsI (penicillin-binding protein 3)
VLGRTDRRLRIVVLLVVFFAFAFGAVSRLAYWQVARGTELAQVALAQAERPIEEQAVRGNILDRHGVVLATTAFRDTLAAYPDQIGLEQRRRVAEALAPILGLDAAGADDLVARLTSGGRYMVVNRELSEAQSIAVRELLATQGIPGLVLEPHAVRLYPSPGGAPGTTLASQLIGFVTASGTGSYGIEQYYDSILAGRPKLLATLRDRDGRPLQSSAQVLDPGTDGQDLHLSIDASLQLQLEKELYAAWVANAAKSASAVIMDPKTGELLAWAAVPGYDANNYARTAGSNPEVLQDPILSQVYEPGSVMKMFTAAAALRDGHITPTTKVRDRQSLVFGTQTIHNSDLKSMGVMRFRDAIAYSRNLATAGVAMRLDRTTQKSAAKLYDAWKTLGIGSLTGVDLSGEVAGIAPDPASQVWQPLDLANRAFGQGVAVTQIQLAVGYAAMANGGYKVQPHLLSGVGSEASLVVAPKRVITAGLAADLKGILRHVTDSVPWYAEGSLIRGYEVGGKTGTAQVWDPERGSYTYNRFNFSFIGYVGGDEPAAVIAVRIGEAVPRVRGQGQLELGITSYQLFRRIAIDTISRLDIPRSTDKDAGFPEHGSAAEMQLFPQRWQAWREEVGKHKRDTTKNREGGRAIPGPAGH